MIRHDCFAFSSFFFLCVLLSLCLVFFFASLCFALLYCHGWLPWLVTLVGYLGLLGTSHARRYHVSVLGSTWNSRRMPHLDRTSPTRSFTPRRFLGPTAVAARCHKPCVFVAPPCAPPFVPQLVQPIGSTYVPPFIGPRFVPLYIVFRHLFRNLSRHFFVFLRCVPLVSHYSFRDFTRLLSRTFSCQMCLAFFVCL